MADEHEQQGGARAGGGEPEHRGDGTASTTVASGRRPATSRGTARPITVVGNPVLHRPCAVVTEFDERLADLIDDMFASMYAADGVGLAANQIGVAVRVFVYDCPDDDGVRHVGHVVNPVLVEPDPAGRVLDEGPEGCLSVPGAYADLARTHHAAVRGQDRDGNAVMVEGTGFFARCLQHEADHLDGRLYIDRLSRRDRRDALRQMEERTPSYEIAAH